MIGTQKQSIIGKFMRTTVGREKLVASMVHPVRLRVDCYGLHKLLKGAAPLEQRGSSWELFPLNWSDTVSTEISPGTESERFERLTNYLRIRTVEAINTRILSWFDSIADPYEQVLDAIEPWPKGYLLMNAELSRQVCQWEGFEAEEEQELLPFGLIGRWKGMVVNTTEFTKPKHVYRIGPSGTVGRAFPNIDLTYNAKVSSGTVFAVDVQLTGHIDPAEDPKVRVTLVPAASSVEVDASQAIAEVIR